MINKIACLLVIISLFMSAANVNAAEDNTDMQILIANQKKGIVNSWSGAQPVAANQSSPTEYLQRTIEFADGSWWGLKDNSYSRDENPSGDMSSWSAAKYAYNSDSETIGIHMWDHSEKWPCFFFHPARAVLAKPVNNIVIGLKSNRAFTLRMFYYNDIEDSMKNYYSIDVESGFHEYTIDKNTIQSSAWSNESVYKNFKFDYDKKTGDPDTNVEIAYIRFMDEDCYAGRCEDSGNGTWIKNGAVNYNKEDKVVDLVLPKDKYFQNHSDITESNVTINNQPVKWVISGNTWQRIRINLGTLKNDTNYTIRFNGVKTTDGKDISDVFTFSIGNPEPTGISISTSSSGITTYHGMLNLTASIQPIGAEDEILWSSSDSSVATVDANGVVTAVKNGTTVITAKLKSKPTITDSITITVSGQKPPAKITYDKIELTKDGVTVNDISSINAGDELSVKISELSNNSEEQVTLDIIAAMYDGELLKYADKKSVTIGAEQTVGEFNFKIVVPQEVNAADKFSVFVWSYPMNPEIKDYYTLN